LNPLIRRVVPALATLLAAGLLAGAPTALAQVSTAVLTGTVVDAATQKPMPDVVVVATSPNLQGERLALTDEAGFYRLAQLPPGTYTLRFESEGFRPYARTGIALSQGLTLRLNAQLLPEALEAVEEISVVGKAPVIDMGTNRTGVSVNADMLRDLALVRPGSKGSAARSFEALAEMAPGAVADTYGVSLNGTSSPENGFLVDGLSVGNPSLGILGTPLSVEFIQEVNVITGGFMPEYGRATGGVFTVETKSGSNEFHGSVFGNLTPGILEGLPAPINSQGSVIRTTQRLWNLGDFGATLGGPIAKDKLWFFAGVAPSFTRRQLNRTLNRFVLDERGNEIRGENGFFQTEPIAGTERSWFADQRTLQYIGKLTWQALPDHTLSLSLYGTPATSGGRGRFGYTVDSNTVEVDNLAGTYDALAHLYEQDARDISLKLASSFLDKRLLLDVTVGWHHMVNNTLPSDGSGIGGAEQLSGTPQFVMQRNSPFYSITDFEGIPDPSLCAPVTRIGANGREETVLPCRVSSYTLGGPGFLIANTLDRYQANAVGTLLLSALGHHVIKAGVDVELMTNRDTRAYSGGVQYTEAADGQSYRDFRVFGYLRGPDDLVLQPAVNPSTQAFALGGFLQDSWSIFDKVTLNVGLRYDTQSIYGTGGSVALHLPNQISPRVGLIYDFTQQGRSKLFANYSRYYQNAVLAMFNSQFSNVIRVRANRNRAPSGEAPGCDPLTQAPPYRECRDERNLRNTFTSPDAVSRRYEQLFSINSPVDPELEPQSTDELVLGGEYELVENTRVGASYTRRYMNAVIEDMSTNEATNYFIGNPGRGIATTFPQAVRDYDAVNVYLTRAFSGGWMAQASYTWSYLRGNYSGLFRPESGQLAPNVTSDFDLVSLLENKDGPLPLDRTHIIKVFGSKEFLLRPDVRLNLGLSYQGQSGTPLNVQGAHYIYGPGLTFILPRGSGGRLPWQNTFDTRVGVDWRLPNGLTTTFSMDIFNLFNFQSAIRADETWTVNTVDAVLGGNFADIEGGRLTVRGSSGSAVQNPNFGKPTAFQAPRSFRFGMRVAF
jgi:outer membrane receptor protein involved in Fe transport